MQLKRISQKIRVKMEDKLDHVFSENAIYQAHSGVFNQVNQKLRLIQNAIGINSHLEIEKKITEIRVLLNDNPKERVMQENLLTLEAIAKLRTVSLSEVFVIKNESSKRKYGRIDILARPTDEDDLGRIIELKRPSIKLIAYKSFPNTSTL